MALILKVLILFIRTQPLKTNLTIAKKAQSPSTHAPKAPNSSLAHAPPTPTAHPPAAASTAANAPDPSSHKSETVAVALAMLNPMTMLLERSLVLPT